MKIKQAQALVSDLLMRCEDEDVALPDDPLDAVLAAARAVQRDLAKQAKGGTSSPAMEHAFRQMRRQYGKWAATEGDRKAGGVTHAEPMEPTPGPQSPPRGHESPPVSPSAKRSRPNPHEHVSIVSPKGRPQQGPKPSPQRKQPNKMRLQDEIAAEPAHRAENQRLVDEIVRLGEYELKLGHTQRGITRLRAAKLFRDYDDVITSGAQAKQLQRVGASTAAKVDDILHHGFDAAIREYQRGKPGTA